MRAIITALFASLLISAAPALAQSASATAAKAPQAAAKPADKPADKATKADEKPKPATPPLVDGNWLKQRLGQKGIVIVDVGDPRVYAQAHIPGAIFTDYGHWRADVDGVHAVLPKKERLAKLMGSLGITPADHVILVPIGYSASDIAAAARIFWTMKTVGHEKVSILDGGLRAWVADKTNPMERKINKPAQTTYEISIDTRWLATAEDVKKALNLGEPQLVDNRRPGEYMGVFASSSVARPGTLPGARNVPQQWLIDERTGRFRPRAQLEKIHKAMGVGKKQAIHFCNTGHRAALGWYVRAMLLGQESRLYDGSLAEWTNRKPEKEYPVEVKINLAEKPEK